MRIRVVQKPTEQAIDGFSLDGFVVGRVYDLDPAIAAVFVAEGWGAPVIREFPNEAGPRETPKRHVDRKRATRVSR